MLTTPEITLLVIIATAMTALVSGRLRADLVAIGILLSLSLTGIVAPEEALVGFSQPVIITLISLFVLARALDDTGVLQWAARQMQRLGGRSEVKTVGVVMLIGAGLSLFMNLVAAGALLLPAVVNVAQESGQRPSRLLIPLSFSTLLGGTATAFATANLLVNSLLFDRDIPALGFLDFFKTGALIIVCGITYMLLIGRRLLPNRTPPGEIPNARMLSRNLYETYGLDDRLWEFQVPQNSPIAGTTLGSTHIGERLGVTVMAIWRGHQAILTPEPDEIIQPGDYLLILGREDRALQLRSWGLMLGRSRNGKYYDPSHDYSVDLTEVIIPPRSNVIGQTLTDLRFRAKYGLTTVALWRGGRSFRTDVGKFPLQVGDALLMVGSAPQIRSLAQEPDFLVLRSGHAARPRSPQKAGLTVAIFALALAGSITGVLPTWQAVLAGMLAVILTGGLTADEAYRAVEWRIIFLIVGMLPISIAMTDTGLAGRLGAMLVSATEGGGVVALVAAVFVLTTIVVQGFGGQVTGLILAPIALAAAVQTNADPRMIALVVGVACSTAFLTPVAHPVNLLMMNTAGYQFGDFTRVGVGLTIVVFIALMIGLAIFWGLPLSILT